MSNIVGFKNVEVLRKSEWCMCYHCVKRFKFSEIYLTTDNGETAICPRCNIDAVVADLDRDKIVDLHDEKFNHGSNPLEEPRNVVRISENVFKKGQKW